MAVPVLHIHPREDLVRLGSDYGGWIVPYTLLDRSSVCYCAGAGEDITFDLALAERFGCEIHVFDPTPRAVAHVERVAVDNPLIHFHPVGLWDCEATLKYRVLQSMLEKRIRPRILCVEFDEAVQRVTRAIRARVKQSVESLLDSGYTLVAQEGRANSMFGLRE